jgi:hypothetical protein
MAAVCSTTRNTGLRRITAAMGGGLSPGGVGAADVGAAVRTAMTVLPVVGDLGARRALERICAQLEGSRDLVLELARELQLPPICVRGAEKRLTPRDLVQLELLRRGSTASSRRGAGPAAAIQAREAPLPW